MPTRSKISSKEKPPRAPRKPKPVEHPADRTTAYALAVQAGEIPAGRMVRAACERHLQDLEAGAARGVVFSVDAAERVFQFIEQFCRLAGGEHEGRPFILQPWQAFIIGCLFGWLKIDGFRRFRVAYIEIGKGNGKSPLAAAIGLYMLIADGEARAEVYAAATKRDQAMILFRDAVAMVDQSPALSGRLTKSGTPGKEWNLAYHANASFFRPISSEDNTQSGPRPHCGLIDEVHEHRTAHIADMMRAGTKGRRQALILEITNSGADRQSVAWAHHEFSEKVLEGSIENDSWFAYVCGLDACDACKADGKTQPVEGCEQCDDWRNPEVWLKANPNLGVSIRHEYLAEQVREAEGMPSKQGIVKRLNFCVWTEGQDRWIDLDLWDACGAPVDLGRLRGRQCFGGLDLSSTTDLSALVLQFPPHEDDPEPAFELLAWFWCPRESILKRAKKDRVPYDLWARQGFIEPTDGNVIDYAFIEARILAVAEDFDLVEVGYDPYNATQLVTNLMAHGIRMVPVRQGFLSLSPPTKALEVRIRNRQLRHGSNPILRWMASNAATASDPAGNVKLVKSSEHARIDGLVAAVNSTERMDRQPQDEAGASVYDTRGVLTL